MNTAGKRPLPPLVVPAVALITGILAARGFEFFPYIVTTASAACFALIILTKRVPPSMRIAACLFFAWGFGSFYLYGPGAPTYASTLADKGSTAVRGVVARPPQERDGYTVLYLLPTPVSPDLMRAGLVRLNVTGTGLGIGYGDIVSGELRLSAPAGPRNPGGFDWGGYARLNGVGATATVKPSSLVKSGNASGPVMGRVYSFRQRLIVKARETLTGPSQAIFRAMILGDQGGVDAVMRERFSASGTTHILSVSGSHIALLAGFVFLAVTSLFRALPGGAALRLSMRLDIRKLAAGLAIPASVAYCLLAGSEPATVRSVIMVCAYLVSILLDRQNQVLNTLSAAAIIVLAADPSALFDISFRLSYMAVLFIALSLEALRRLPDIAMPGGRRLEGIYRKSASAVLMSLAAIAGTAPLAAGQFHTFSLIALPANLAVLPLAGFLVVPLGLVSCLLSALGLTNGIPLAWLNTHSLDAFYGVVGLFASVPHVNLHPPSPGIIATTIYYAAAITALSWRTTFVRRAALAAVALAVLAAGTYRPADGVMRVCFLDVGQGECALVELPHGSTMLIDCGGPPSGSGPGRDITAPYIWERGIGRIDYAVISHPQSDHISGMEYLITSMPVGQLWEGGLESGEVTYTNLCSAAAAKGVPRYVLPEGRELTVDGVTVQALHTASSRIDDARLGGAARANNRSLVLRLKYREVSFLLTGDVQDEAQISMMRSAVPMPLRSTVLKVPHHGSRNACLPAFIDAVSPRVAVVCAGRNNRFGHPWPGTLDSLRTAGAGVYCTASDGAVTVTTDGRYLDVRTCRDSDMVNAGGWEGERANIARLLSMRL